MSKFTDALHEYVRAEREFRTAEYAMARWRSNDPPEVPEAYSAAGDRLAQAGDVLESVLRQMMIDAVNAAADRFRPRQPWP